MLPCVSAANARSAAFVRPSTLECPVQTSDQKLEPAVDELRSYFDGGSTRDYQWRQQQLTGLLKFLYKERDAIQQALRADLSKNKAAATGESIPTGMEILVAKRNLRRWMRDERVGTSLLLAPGSSFVRREPLGVVLIFGAWNYPLHLTLTPLAGALAAGNCVVLKPSELAPAMSNLLAARLHEYVDPAAVKVVEGGPAVAEELLDLEFGHIFYTGNGAIGSRVMQAAAKNLTPVTLELGGKSPVIVEKSADLQTTARRISLGKWANAGQTCVAPDYVLVEKTVEENLLRALKETLVDFYGPEPRNNPAFGKIVNQRHVERLKGLLGSGRIVAGGEVNAADRYVAPTILRDVRGDEPVMQEEIFGPILPVIPVESVGHAIRFINARAKPLALYLFTKDKAVERDVLARTSSGGVCINHVALQLANPNLPFGGVGASGMGAYHGKASFETFSHRKAVLKKSFFFDPDFMYPSFKKNKARKANHQHGNSSK